MPSFKALISQGRQNVTRFFNSTLPSLTQKGVRFFSGELVPAARRLHHVQNVISKELTTNPNVAPKLKEAAQRTSAFADLGLKKLGEAEEATSRVAHQLGIA